MDRKSVIFSKNELEVLVQRMNGDYSDKTGTFSGRVKPKINEILMWNQPKFKKMLKKVMKQVRYHHNDEDYIDGKPQEMSYTEFEHQSYERK